MTPDAYTISEQFLNVGDGHQLYIQDWGNPKAKTPIIFLHGGPGSQSQDKHKGIYNPFQHRVIFFDQRGCGRSLPFGSLEHNTTQDLIEDIEKIASHMNLTKFVLVGGSWGCCLALVYALKYPKRIAAMVLNGIFTGTKKEMDWIAKGEFRLFFPEAWDSLLEQTPAIHKKNPAGYHISRILGNDKSSARKSAYIYGNVESSLLALDDRFTPPDLETYDETSTKIETHYSSNDCFLPDKYVIDKTHKLTMPIWLIQGRYDMVCPPITAYELDKKLPDSHLVWTVGGHKAERESWNVQRTILSQWN